MAPKPPNLSFLATLQRALAALEANRLTVRIPHGPGLRERRSGMTFHATPELFFQERGSTVFTLPHGTFELRAGEICLMPRGMPHSEKTSLPHENFSTIVTMFHHASFSLHRGHSSPLRSVISQPLTHFGAHTHAKIMRYLDEMVTAKIAGIPIGDPQIRGLLLAALALMIRETQIPNPAAAKSAGHSPLITRCLDLVEANLCEPGLTVKWLAEHLHCSADHLSRAFRREMRQTLIGTIHDQRVTLAVRLLDEQALNVGEVAWTCGFATQSYFNRVFRRHIGTTPRQFRASR